jgi:tartrate dehydrogenase/decarboxylase/D-malate dehydrogenase
MEKRNVMKSGVLWNQVVTETHKAKYSDVELEHMLADAGGMQLVRQPKQFDVIVTDNLFGDIITDLAAAVTGGIGLAASGNVNPSGAFPSMFEPVHGSAPDIAGQGVANPVGAVWSAALMLEHLGHPEAAADVVAAMESTLAKPETRTADLGGTASTAEVTEALVAQLR